MSMIDETAKEVKPNLVDNWMGWLSKRIEVLEYEKYYIEFALRQITMASTEIKDERILILKKMVKDLESKLSNTSTEIEKSFDKGYDEGFNDAVNQAREQITKNYRVYDK